jgi:hypothetical protein
MNILQLAGSRGIRFDTYPDHWRCRKCESPEPHVHEERGDDGVWRWRDYGYDVRDEP